MLTPDMKEGDWVKANINAEWLRAQLFSLESIMKPGYVIVRSRGSRVWVKKDDIKAIDAP